MWQGRIDVRPCHSYSTRSSQCRPKIHLRTAFIALLTAYRRQGIGSVYLEGILGQARTAGLAVRIHVEHYNPAMILYKRLGFQKIGDSGVYFLIEWLPDSQ
ncbi:MAG: GNAT family N-acetyltransferase [bacterium]|nr:GNAT family N-acetyltransferase [bacterium]